MSVKMVQSFLGLCNFFRTHIKSFHILSQPLNKHLHKDSELKGGGGPSSRRSHGFQQTPIGSLFWPHRCIPACRPSLCSHSWCIHRYCFYPQRYGFHPGPNWYTNKIHVILYGSRQLTDAEKIILRTCLKCKLLSKVWNNITTTSEDVNLYFTPTINH